MVSRNDEITPGGPGATAELLDPLRLLWIGGQPAIGHEVFGIMRPLALVKNGLHGLSPRASYAVPASVMYWVSVVGSKPTRS